MMVRYRVGELNREADYDGKQMTYFSGLELDKRYKSKAGTTRSVKAWMKHFKRYYGLPVERTDLSVQALCLKFDTQRNFWVQADSVILPATDWLNTKHRDEVLDKLGWHLVNPHMHEARMRQEQQHDE